MNKKTKKICIVVATKDRPEELSHLLLSINNQSVVPHEVVIIDGGNRSNVRKFKNYSNLHIKYIQTKPPSATRQRNIGIKNVDKNCDYIGILDDDIILEKKAIENMMGFWKNADGNVGGAAFNLMNHPEIYAEKFKSMRIIEKLGLYSKKSGKVTAAGFQTLIGKAKETVFVDWFSSEASVWKKHIFESYGFDEWYTGYSYLEDLDFSYTVGKKYKLAVVADAGCYHFPASGGRGSGFEFGVKEVLNRLYFIKKHKELSFLKCILALKVRQLMSVWLFFKERKIYFLSRAFGNSVGFIKSIIQNK